MIPLLLLSCVQAYLIEKRKSSHGHFPTIKKPITEDCESAFFPVADGPVMFHNKFDMGDLVAQAKPRILLVRENMHKDQTEQQADVPSR